MSRAYWYVEYETFKFVSLNTCSDIDILEEFAYIKTQDGGRVLLDILPTSTKTIAQ